MNLIVNAISILTNLINCLNCHHALNVEDRYCSICGQEVKESKTSVRDLISQFFGDLFTFDSKIFKSLKPLLFNPGFLTIEYNAGRRASYIPPLRLYIFISIIYFFTLSMMSSEDDSPNITFTKKPKSGQIIFGSETESLRVESIEQAYLEGTETSLLDSLGLSHTKFNELFIKAGVKQYMKLHVSNAGYMQYLRKVVSFMMFFVMPAMGVWLLLFYYQKSNWYMDHLIFSFHFHSLLFLVLTFAVLLSSISEWFYVMAGSYLLWYFYKSLRTVYDQKAGITLLKMTGLGAAGFFVLAFALLSSFLASFFLF